MSDISELAAEWNKDITELDSERATETLVSWLRSIADNVERRGVEALSLNCFSVVATAEVRDPDAEFVSYEPTSDYFMAASWRYVESA